MSMTITLDNDPWSRDLWARQRALIEAMRAMLAGDDRPYEQYWRRRVKGSDEEFHNVLHVMREWAFGIRDHGYQPEHWRTCGRVYDESRGQGPLSIIVMSDGRLSIHDGTHRAAILRALGRPVTATVWKRDEKWEALRTFYERDRYQPLPHPDMPTVTVIRRNADRMNPIASALLKDTMCFPVAGDAWPRAHCITIVGACYGAEAALLRVAGYMGEICNYEPNPDRSLLCRCRCTVEDIGTCARRSAERVQFHRFDAAIGLSVYHHCATSLAKWKGMCKKLAACPIHFIEIPRNDSPTWHDQFRREADGDPAGRLRAMLRAAGKYDARAIFVDHQYDNRTTEVFYRKQ